MKKITAKSLYDININNRKQEYYETHEIILSELIKLFSEDSVYQISKYDHNRGNMPLNSKHYNKISNEFHVESLGIFPLALNPETKTYHQFDGHNRRKAIMNRFYSSKMTNYELNSLVLIRIYTWDNRIVTYSTINNAAGHTSRNKFNNPDEAIGQFLLKMKNKTGFKIPSNWYSALGSVALSLNDGYEKNNYAYIVGAGVKNKTQYLNCSPEQDAFPNLKGVKLSNLINGLKRTVEIFKALKEEIKASNGTLPKEAESLLKSATLFGLILLDSCQTIPQFVNKETDKLVYNILRNGGKDLHQATKRGAKNQSEVTAAIKLLKINPHRKTKEFDFEFEEENDNSFNKEEFNTTNVYLNNK